PQGGWADEGRRDEPRDIREDDEVRPVLLQDLRVLALEGGPGLPEGPLVDHDGGNVRLLRPREDRRSRHVAYEDDEVRGEVPAVARVHETLEVSAPPGREHPDPKTCHRIPSVLEQSRPREDHGDSEPVGGGNYFRIADRTARLRDRDDAPLCQLIEAIPEREVGVA